MKGGISGSVLGEMEGQLVVRVAVQVVQEEVCQPPRPISDKDHSMPCRPQANGTMSVDFGLGTRLKANSLDAPRKGASNTGHKD